MATLQSRLRQRVGPKDYTGTSLAALLALLIFTVLMSLETQHIARLDGYRADLGKPIVGRFYQPFASLQWMAAVDQRFDLSRAIRGGAYLAGAGDEKPWARAAFAAERRRLPFEILGPLLLLAIGAIVTTRTLATTGLYGNARWATEADKRRSSLTKSHSGIALGQDPKTHELYVHDGEATVLGLGPPGSGKTTGIAEPTLIGTWGTSAIVFDPTGDLRDRTIEARRTLGAVYVFDPRDPDGHAYNPLAGVAAEDNDLIFKILSAAMLERDLSEMTDTSRFFMTNAIEFGTAVVARAIEVRGGSFAAAADLYYAGGWANDTEFCENLMTSEIPYVAEPPRSSPEWTPSCARASSAPSRSSCRSSVRTTSLEQPGPATSTSRRYGRNPRRSISSCARATKPR